MMKAECCSRWIDWAATAGDRGRAWRVAWYLREELKSYLIRTERR